MVRQVDAPAFAAAHRDGGVVVEVREHSGYAAGARQESGARR